MQHKGNDVPMAHDGGRTLRDWRRFFRQGLQYRHLTRRLYEHLTRRCGFIVRQGRRGFYEAYIEDPDEFLAFLDQFDRRAGCRSVETGSTDWLEGAHADLNSAMVDAVAGMVPAFRDYARRMIERAATTEIEAAQQKLAKARGWAA